MSILEDRETTVVLNGVDVNVTYNYEPRYINPEYAYGCTDEVIEIQKITFIYGELEIELLSLLNKETLDDVENQLSDQMCDYYANKRDEEFYES